MATDLERAVNHARKERRRKPNPFWRSRPTSLDKLRCFAAYAMREAGATQNEIADVLDVSVPTAAEYVAYGKKWWA